MRLLLDGGNRGKIIGDSNIIDDEQNSFTPISADKTKQKVSNTKYSYWGNILDEIQDALLRNNSNELSIISAVVDNAHDMLTRSKELTMV